MFVNIRIGIIEHIRMVAVNVTYTVTYTLYASIIG